MKKYLMAVFVMIYSFLSVNLLFAATFTQADLGGTWHMNLLRTGFHDDGTTPKNEWMRATVTINSSSGVVSCVSMTRSSGEVTCPTPFDLTFTMNETTGVITQSGTNAANVGTDHMTMTVNKKLLVGTATNNNGPGYSYQMMLAQKEVSGTTYSSSDTHSKNFVIHELMVGAQNNWKHSVGSTDAAGAITISSQTDPGSTTTPGALGITISVDGNGIVSISSSDMATYQGFMSDDKKTVVGTFTDGETVPDCYHLMIIQVTGQVYPAGTVSAGIAAQHILASGPGSSAFWLHYTNTMNSGGVMTFSEWVASNPGVTAPQGTMTGYIDASGTITIDGNPTYHGQVSDDRTFTVGTQTFGASPNFFYGLNVSTKVTSGTALYATFTGAGVWEWNGTTWTQRNAQDPANMAASGSSLYATFTGAGVWEWNGTTWTQRNAQDPANMAASGSSLYATFTGAGVWEWNGTTWTQRNAQDPANMAASGSSLYATFTGAGVWEWNGTTWTQRNAQDPANMAASGSSLYATFTGAGVWEWNGTTWTQRNAQDPANMAASGSSLYATFTGHGVWEWNGTTWTQRNAQDPANMAAALQ